MDHWILKQLRAQVINDLFPLVPPGHFKKMNKDLKLDSSIKNSEYLSFERNWGHLAAELGRKLYFYPTVTMTARQVAASEVLMHLGMLALAKTEKEVVAVLAQRAKAEGHSGGNLSAIAEDFNTRSIPTFTDNVLGALTQYLSYLSAREAKPFLPLVAPPEESPKQTIERPEDNHPGDDGPLREAAGGSRTLRKGEKKKVFVVHGRNSAARNALFTFLRCIGLQPIEWAEAVRFTGKASPFIGEILDAAFTQAQAIVVLLTPDDIAYLDNRFVTDDDPPHEKNPTPQPRQNVLFEAGMAMGRDPNRTIFVELGKIRPFSDIYGRHVVRINNTSERRQDLADRLLAAGCDIDISNRDWHFSGDFESSISECSSEKRCKASDLTTEGQTLLKKAAIGENGSILRIVDVNGTELFTDRFQIRTDDPPRRKARYTKAFDDLVRLHLIHASNLDKNLFEVTDFGYLIADSLSLPVEDN